MLRQSLQGSVSPGGAWEQEAIWMLLVSKETGPQQPLFEPRLYNDGADSLRTQMEISRVKVTLADEDVRIDVKI